MNRLPDTDDDLRYDTPDREISLGTPTILGIFFALALVCAIFFGLGYTMGRKSTQSTGTLADAAPTAGLAKPTAAGSPAYTAPAAAPTPPPSDSPAAVETTTDTPTTQTQTPTPSAAIPTPAAPAPQLTTNNQQPATTFMVQVAAVSSQDVADIELAALQKKGYAVAVHHEPQDQLLHIQIGPFTNRKDAEAMRTRVLADGFNAIVK